MKKAVCFAAGLILLSASSLSAQSGFSAGAYLQYIDQNRDLSTESLSEQFKSGLSYYKGKPGSGMPDRVAFLDSIALKYGLTEDEKNLLALNRFVVTERLSFGSFGAAFSDVWHKDLPVFLSTDAVLHALHMSYDAILRDVEQCILLPALDSLLSSLRSALPDLQAEYAGDGRLALPLEDVDLYISMAYSLLRDSLSFGRIADPDQMQEIWNLIESEQMAGLALFCNIGRNIDFSQFRVRGHYTEEFWDAETGEMKQLLAPYFKSMMWLGRVDFWLSPAKTLFVFSSPEEIEKAVLRMNLASCLLNKLIDRAGSRPLLEEIDGLLSLLVGESDNLTPAELSRILTDLNIADASLLLDATLYDSYMSALLSDAASPQKILSDFLYMDPFSSLPDTLPVSFRLLGQRFIVDSYILGNVVYDRIVHRGIKIKRMLPDPLDALFVLGNDNALPLLRGELDFYHYATQLSGLRYLVDSYDGDFWGASLYNAWLQAIRSMNPSPDTTGLPFFMRTAAWQQEKMNSQLASWAQLRHDNLLYAKPSYTGGIICSFPHSFVEPNPDFFSRIAAYADQAQTVLSPYLDTRWELMYVTQYFPRLKNLMQELEILARKEINREPFTAADIQFLQGMVASGNVCGEPNVSGWYSQLFYLDTDVELEDYPVADIHTQPTDEFGFIIGRVLHAGTGKVNLGVFLADSPSLDFKPVAFAGPVMSYYEKVTENFDRFTDERWHERVEQDALPARPDWVNIYLADQNGSRRGPGREIPGVLYSGVDEKNAVPAQFAVRGNFPNPFNSFTRVRFYIPDPSELRVSIHDMRGRMVCILVEGLHPAGAHEVSWNAGDHPSGLYFCRVKAGDQVRSIKLMLVR
ncbi:DUF3160 domain-containing protein [bacterium]|nr:DUF3160 domain-containing protein [bacterium]